MKAFTSEEKDYYLKQLFEKGRLIFSKYGIKKTTVEDLTKAVGIAKGSFYMFYKSKEDLFFYILTQEISELRQNLSLKLFQSNDEPYLLVKKLLNRIIESLKTNPIIAISVSLEGKEILEREAIKKELKTYGDIKIGLQKLFTILIDKGIVIPLDPNLIVNLVRTLFIVITNKDKLDEEFFDQTIELMIDSIAKGITVK